MQPLLVLLPKTDIPTQARRGAPLERDIWDARLARIRIIRRNRLILCLGLRQLRRFRRRSLNCYDPNRSHSWP